MSICRKYVYMSWNIDHLPGAQHKKNAHKDITLSDNDKYTIRLIHICSSGHCPLVICVHKVQTFLRCVIFAITLINSFL